MRSVRNLHVNQRSISPECCQYKNHTSGSAIYICFSSFFFGSGSSLEVACSVSKHIVQQETKHKVKWTTSKATKNCLFVHSQVKILNLFSVSIFDGKNLFFAEPTDIYRQLVEYRRKHVSFCRLLIQ